jgi:hypothetical protein
LHSLHLSHFNNLCLSPSHNLFPSHILSAQQTCSTKFMFCQRNKHAQRSSHSTWWFVSTTTLSNQECSKVVQVLTTQQPPPLSSIFACFYIFAILGFRIWRMGFHPSCFM